MRKTAKVVSLAAYLLSQWSVAAHGETLAQRHTRAIDAYRAGRGDEAINSLKRLHREQPSNQLFTYDSVRVMSALEHDAEALEAFQSVSPNLAPVDVLAAGAKSARNLQRFDLALQVYRLALMRKPSDLQLRLGYALSLADAGNTQQAVVQIRSLANSSENSNRADVFAAYAYILEHAADFVGAAAAHKRVLALDANNKQAWRGLILDISKMGAAHLAANLVDQHALLFSPMELKRLRSDRAASQIRWGDVPPISNATRFSETDRALAFLDAVHEKSWDTLDLSDESDRRLAFDRMIALRDRVRMPEVVVLYERMLANSISPPAWSLTAAADAYLYLDHPEKAIPIYLQVLKDDPQNPNTAVSLFYAYEDINDHNAALSTIDRYAASQMAWVPDRDGQGLVPNGRRLDADVTATMGQAYADRLSVAQLRLEGLSQAAPGNLGLHANLGNVYLWRGWPERARREFDQVLAAEPEGRVGRSGRAAALLALQDYPATEREVDSLTLEFPENKRVQRLQRSWDIHNRREAYNETRVGFANGRDFDGSSVSNDFYVFASPMAYNYRPYFRDHLATAEVREGNAVDHRAGVGLEYTAPHVVARTELYQGTEDNSDTGWSGSARWLPDDYWQFSANTALNTTDVPLRGLRAGVDGDQIGVGAAYRWHESQEIGAAYNHYFYSDGNDRDAVSGYFTRRIVTGPYHKLTATLGAYTSRNSRDDVIYFSPKSDYSTSLTVESLWNVYRRYERKFNQRIAGTVGGYWQHGFDAEPIWSVLYEHQWGIDDTLAFNYGYVHNQRVYDGVGESEDALYGNVDWRF